MQAVILAGGVGKRIKALAGDLPKALLPVAGCPFIERQLELLARHGLRNILLCVGYRADQIQARLGNGTAWGMHLSYSQENPNHLLGTGGALINALPLLDEAFLVLYGDSYLPTNYRVVIEAFCRRCSQAMMCVYCNREQWDKSNVRIADERVVYYSKQAAPGEADYIDYGLSVYRKETIQAYAQEEMPLDLGAIQEDLVRQGVLDAFEVRERFYEIGKPEGVAELEQYLSKNKACGEESAHGSH